MITYSTTKPKKKKREKETESRSIDENQTTLLFLIFLTLLKVTNVFYRYFAQYGYFDRAESSVFQVRWQRQRDQSPHLFAMRRASELDFMIISPRTKSEINFLQN
jgi:hypothetical protein